MFRVISINNASHTVTLANDKGQHLTFTFPEGHQSPEKKLAYIEKRTRQHKRLTYAKMALKCVVALIGAYIVLKVRHVI